MPPLSVPSRLNSEAGVMNEHTLIRRADRQLMGRGMRPRVLAICLLLALPGFAQPASQWVLEKSTLTYHVSHQLTIYRQLMGRGMRPRVLAICLLLALPGFAQPASQWVLEKSTLTYHVSHQLT